ncbi:MAG: nuclear transport factor 2 family protein [Halobacteriota archaeon]
MKLFKSPNPNRRMSRLINEFQYSMQSGDYWTAKRAVEQALRIDPQNDKLHDMKRMTLELITMQDEQRGAPRSHATAPQTPTKTEATNRPHAPQRDFDDVKRVIDLYRVALINGEVDAGVSLWDEAASTLIYVTANDGEVHKGFYEVRNALRAASARTRYATHELVDQGIDLYGDLACAFSKTRFERHEKGSETALSGTLTTTLVLKKTGSTWKIVQGHESTVTNTPQ